MKFEYPSVLKGGFDIHSFQTVRVVIKSLTFLKLMHGEHGTMMYCSCQFF